MTQFLSAMAGAAFSAATLSQTDPAGFMVLAIIFSLGASIIYAIEKSNEK